MSTFQGSFLPAPLLLFISFHWHYNIEFMTSACNHKESYYARGSSVLASLQHLKKAEAEEPCLRVSVHSLNSWRASWQEAQPKWKAPWHFPYARLLLGTKSGPHAVEQPLTWGAQHRLCADSLPSSFGWEGKSPLALNRSPGSACKAESLPAAWKSAASCLSLPSDCKPGSQKA